MPAITLEELAAGRPDTVSHVQHDLVSLACVLHNDERLPSYYRELHHVMPQAWQLVWWPDKFNVQPPLVGVPPSAHQLWDSRTEPCCPTGHRNVHYILVFLMKLWEQDYQSKKQTPAAIKACKANGVKLLHASGLPASPNEAAMASDGMLRWDEWGGDLSTLTARKLYGYA